MGATPLGDKLNNPVPFKQKLLKPEMGAIKGRDLFDFLGVDDDASKLHGWASPLSGCVFFIIPQEHRFSNRRNAPSTAFRRWIQVNRLAFHDNAALQYFSGGHCADTAFLLC
jgi:DNA phosphorothioation-dependent restriction protein DptG